jgi:hypothetical protein
MFHQPGLNNAKALSLPMKKDIVQSWDEERPPRFRLKTVGKVKEAVLKYDAFEFGEWGKTEIRAWFGGASVVCWDGEWRRWRW